MTHEPNPVSPCVGICLLDPATGYCRGCLRSMAEIAGRLARLTGRRFTGAVRDLRY